MVLWRLSFCKYAWWWASKYCVKKKTTTQNADMREKIMNKVLAAGKVTQQKKSRSISLYLSGELCHVCMSVISFQGDLNCNVSSIVMFLLKLCTVLFQSQYINYGHFCLSLPLCFNIFASWLTTKQCEGQSLTQTCSKLHFFNCTFKTPRQKSSRKTAIPH